MSMRLSDPQVTKLFIAARFDTLRGGRPHTSGHRGGPRPN
jgi:hypothetical protein